VLLLTEDDVARLLTMPAAVDAVEEALRQQAAGAAESLPRRRLRTPSGALHLMAGSTGLGYLGLKAYTTFADGAQFVVLLYDAHDGQLLALIQADRLGQIRTGAASGVATRHLALADATTVGIFGTGWQARSQLEAVRTVRSIRIVKAYGRDRERREAFCRDMTALLGVEVQPVERPEEVVEGSRIVVTATTSARPVFDGRHLEPGTHVNAMGSNSLLKCEVDEAAVRRADLVVVDSIEQAKLESGDLLGPIERGHLSWARVRELDDVVAGRVGRRTREEITLFESHGLGLEDVAAAARTYELARERGFGLQVPL